MKRIIIVSDTQSMLVGSLRREFEEKGFEVILATGLVHDIDMAMAKKPDVGVLYCDEKITSKSAVMVFLRDKCVEADLPLFVIGDKDELRESEKVFPSEIIPRKFTRPINIKDACAEMCKYVSEHDVENRKKILVVDDSGAMLRNVKGWLEGRYQVILANSGTMAIKYLALNKPDLILLDYEMPIIDGKIVLEMIRSEAEFADVPVIFLTGKNDKESVAKVVRLKPDGYLLKTMKPEEIVQSIDEFFMKQKSKKALLK